SKNFSGERFRGTPKILPVSRSIRPTTPLATTRRHSPIRPHPQPAATPHPPHHLHLHNTTAVTSPQPAPPPPKYYHHVTNMAAIISTPQPPLPSPSTHRCHPCYVYILTTATSWQPPSPLSPSTAGPLPPQHHAPPLHQHYQGPRGRLVSGLTPKGAFGCKSTTKGAFGSGQPSKETPKSVFG
nr:hypothetical protein [Tanacetum cinerariifolium]